MDALIHWWQYLPQHLDPYIFTLGSFRVGWYGLMYVLAFLTMYLFGAYRIRTEGFPYSEELLQDYIVWAAAGLLIGARVGYVLFYNFSYYLHHPFEVIMPVSFESGGVRFTGIAGMSYHGGAIGVFLSSAWYLRRMKVDLWEFADLIVPMIPLAYTFGRIGNFINGELYGRATDVAWGMYFPLDITGALRHPSQLYEALFEGLVLFGILWTLRKSSKVKGAVLAFYLIGYGGIRFVLEFFREPDAHLGFVALSLSMGQVLCFAMIAMGAGLYFYQANRG